MPYNSTHPEYDYIKSTWQKMRDCVKGQKAIHDKGPAYLPKLDQQTPAQYDAYKSRALFLNATAKTIDTLRGLVFRKEPTIVVPQQLEDWKDDITASGTSVKTAASQTFTELETVGRVGWLVDFPTVEGREMTRAEMQSTGARPFAKMYAAESIINWRTDTINGKDQLVLVVLKELVLDAADEFDTSTYRPQYRVLDLVDGRYRVRVFQDVDERSATPEEIYPQVNGKSLDYIPFVMLNEDGISWETKVPPLSGLADINLSHYKAYADYRHGLHYVGLPTPVISGVDDDGKPLTIGPSAVLTIPTEAKAYYLEFEGSGIGSLKDELESLKNDMAAFGARLLRTEKRAVEAAETAAINRAGETSTVASWAAVVDQGLTKVLEIMAEWAGVSGEIRVDLNKDYMPMMMDAQTLTATMNAVVNGYLSKEEFFELLKRGEIIAEEKDYDMHRAEIEADGPTLEME